MGRFSVGCGCGGYQIRSVKANPSPGFFYFLSIYPTAMKRMIPHMKSIFSPKSQLLRFVFILIFSLCFTSTANSQLYAGHEENFAYKVKQIDEFFERFNDEGTLIKDYLFDQYDNLELSREDLLISLFDLKSNQLQKEEVASFIKLVTNPENPVTLSFYDQDWYARVKCAVVYEEKERDLLLLMRIQQEENGASKWVVHQVYADFLKSPKGNNPHASLNPVSHATDFMGLNRAFEDPQNLKAYLSSGFQDDQLSKFAIELQNNRITFQQVENISYHFFQIDGWIFTVENFRRPEKNSGWLISRLIQADAEEKKEFKQLLLKEKI
jgi:hypothetical protein